MSNSKLKEVVANIKAEKVFENPEYWEENGLIPSDQKVIDLLTKASNIFIEALLLAEEESDSDEEKLIAVKSLVENLPWTDLDTEEIGLLVEVIAPAIEAMGFNPWTIF